MLDKPVSEKTWKREVALVFMLNLLGFYWYALITDSEMAFRLVELSTAPFLLWGAAAFGMEQYNKWQK